MANILRRFKYNVPSLNNIVPLLNEQSYNIKGSSPTPTEQMNQIFIEKSTTVKAYFSRQSSNATWNDLVQVELSLPRTNPKWIHTLTTPFAGCSWIFGLTANALLAYHDRNPKDNFNSKMDGIRARGATSIFRMDENDVSQFLLQQYGYRSTWVYGTAPSTPDKISSAVCYAEFANSVWNLHIQDTFAVPGQQYVDYVPQNINERTYRIV